MTPPPSPGGRLWVEALAVGLLYAAVGRLSMAPAIPPGNVCPVWPPSGIALAAVLIGGRGRPGGDGGRAQGS